MKKLLSVVLVLAMLASMCVYLPMGISAAEASATPETIYAEDFANVADGTYTLADLADMLGWTLLRGSETATATIADGKLTVVASDLDAVFEMDTDARYKANHTIVYDRTIDAMDSTLGDKTRKATIYTGTDDGTTTKAVIANGTWEGYHQLGLANGKIGEGAYSKGMEISGGDHGQARSDGPFEVLGAAKNLHTWKTVIDVTNDQVDAYTDGARINSSCGAQKDAWAAYDIADYVGEGAYLRIQKGYTATFDNISIVTGGTAIVNNTNVVYEQNFDNLTYDASTESLRDLADKIGWQTLTATSKNNVGTATMSYAIKDGRFEILAAPSDGKTASGYNANQMGLWGYLYIPEMETAKEAVSIEYDMTYLYDSTVYGSLNNGDTPFDVEMYGRRVDFMAHWSFSQKGFPFYGFRNGNYKVGSTQYYVNSYGIDSTSSNGQPSSTGRYEHFNWNATFDETKSQIFSNEKDNYYHSLIGSTEHIKAVLDYDDGMIVYVNGVVAIQLSPAQLESWTTTKGGANAQHTDIIGNLLRFRAAQGCHVALDNFKVEIDPVSKQGPDLLITEASCGVTASGWCTVGGAEYVEVYNNSTKVINIYDYALVQRSYSGGNNKAGSSCDNVGTEIGLDNITLLYPDTHTFKSIKLAEDGVTPLYTYDITNPSYEEGWIQPGEVVILWNKTDSMHNSAYSSPSVETTAGAANYGMGTYGNITLDDFRAGLVGLPETTKVFQMYNDYNRAFNNSGYHFVGLVDRELVQKDYDPATGSGDETLTNAKIGFTDYASSLIDVCNGKDSTRTIMTVTYATYDYSFNNSWGYGDVTIARPLAANTAASMTPGYVLDSQKRAFDITVDGSVQKGYLGEDFDFNYYVEDNAEYANYRLLFAEVNGKLITDGYVLKNITAPATIERYKVAMKTLAGASVRTTGETAGLRWVTAIKNSSSHLGKLIDSDLVTKIEIGTLVARPDDLGDAALTMENTTENGGKVRKVVAYVDNWYTNEVYEDFSGYSLFAGGVGDMFISNYEKAYCAVGYLTVTVEGLGEITVYGDYVAEDHDRVAIDVIDAAISDYELMMEESELTADQEAEFNTLLEYADQLA